MGAGDVDVGGLLPPDQPRGLAGKARHVPSQVEQRDAGGELDLALVVLQAYVRLPPANAPGAFFGLDLVHGVDHQGAVRNPVDVGDVDLVLDLPLRDQLAGR